MSNKPIWEKDTKIPMIGVSVPNIWIIAILVVVFFTGLGAGIRRRYDLPSGWDLLSGITGEDIGEPSAGEYFFGTMSVVINEQDYLTKTSASPTSAGYILFNNEPGTGSETGTVVSGTTTFTLKEGSKGLMWIAMDSGTDFFTYVDKAIANDYVVQWYISDWDDDQDLDLVVQVDVSDLAPPNPEYQPTFSFELPLIDEDVALAIDSPSDQASIGETEVVKNIEWTVSGFTELDGCAIGEIKFTTNATEEGGEIEIEQLYIGGQVTYLGKKQFSDGHRTSYGDYAEWYVESEDSGDYLSEGAVLVFREKGRADTLTLSINVRCTFANNEEVQITASVTPLDADGSKGTAVSDAVILKESA